MGRNLPKALAIPLAIVAIPFAAIAALVCAIFGLKEKRTAEEVATYLREFIEDSDGAWDWDDFTSVPIADPQLEDIRSRAADVQLPVTDEGDVTLRMLLVEAEELAALAQCANAK